MRLIPTILLALPTLLLTLACGSGPKEPEYFEVGGFFVREILRSAQQMEPGEARRELIYPDKWLSPTYVTLRHNQATYYYETCPSRRLMTRFFGKHLLPLEEESGQLDDGTEYDAQTFADKDMVLTLITYPSRDDCGVTVGGL